MKPTYIEREFEGETAHAEALAFLLSLLAPKYPEEAIEKFADKEAAEHARQERLAKRVRSRREGN